MSCKQVFSLAFDKFANGHQVITVLPRIIFTPSSLDALSARLSELRFEDTADLDSRYKLIASTIAEFDTGLTIGEAYDQWPTSSNYRSMFRS